MPKIIKSAVGAFTASDISVDSSGRVYTASSGTGGDKNLALTTVYNGPASGTFTATPNTSKIQVYVRGAGGAGGQTQGQPGSAGQGAPGGFGLWSVPVTQPYAVPYSIGAGGAAGNLNQPGAAGAATTFADNYTANGGNGGTRSPPSPGSPGTVGTSPGSTVDYQQPTAAIMGQYILTNPIGIDTTNTNFNANNIMGSEAGGGGGQAVNGNPGGIKVYEDIG